MKMRCSLIEKIFLTITSVVLLTAGLPRVTAAAPPVVVPMQVQQGSLVSLKIPQLDSGMPGETMALFNEHHRQVVFKRLREFESVAYETRLVPQLPDAVKNALVFMADYELFLNDEKVISLTQKIYQFTGGAHGMTWLTGHTIDVTAGRSLLLPDLFTSPKNYRERLNQFVRAEGVARNLPMWGFEGVRDDSKFYLNETGIVLFFQQYEIAPYSEGIVRVLVPYPQVADILRSEFFK